MSVVLMSKRELIKCERRLNSVHAATLRLHSRREALIGLSAGTIRE
jgi:hypothetical protein